MFENSSPQKGVVENAREARERRALAKLREVSAVKIQALVRGFIVRKKTSNAWLKEIDQIIGYFETDRYDSKSIKKTTKNTFLSAENQTKPSDWKYATFSNNTLVGAFGNLAKGKNQQIIPQTTNELSPESKSQTETVAETKPEKQYPKPQRVPAVKLLEIITKFEYIFNEKRDHSRFSKTCEYIINSISNEKATKFSYVYLCLQKQYAMRWISQVKSLLEHCLKYLYNQKVSDYSITSTRLYLNVLNSFVSLSNWKIVEKIPQTLTPVLKQICASFCHEMIEKNIIYILGKIMNFEIVSVHSKQSWENLSKSYSLILQVLNSSAKNQLIINDFTKHVLSVPGLLWHLRNLDKNDDDSLLPLILKNLHTTDQHYVCGIVPGERGGEVKALCILSNIVQWAAEDIKSLSDYVIYFVLIMNNFFAYLNQMMALQNTSSSTWHPVLGFCSNNDTSKMKVMSAVKEQMKYFWNADLLRCVFRDVLNLKSLHEDDATPAQAEQITTRTIQKANFQTKIDSFLMKFAKPRNTIQQTGGRNTNFIEVINTVNVCVMYHSCLAVLTKQLRLEMLTGLTFMDGILTRLWRFISELGTSGGLNLFVDSLKRLDNPTTRSYFAVFTLFCDMTSHIISILDDVEFYDLQIPFHLEELVTMSSYLNTFVFRIIWGKMYEDSRLTEVYHSAHALLLMLYDRDARRPFTPKDHWLCRDVKPSTIRDEVDKGSQRAFTVFEKVPFVLPHRVRVMLFRTLVNADKSKHSSDDIVHMTVHRSRIVEDGFQYLSRISPDVLKGTVRIKFINDLGLDEAGIDQDGVFKEFLEETITRVFNPDMNLFRTTPNDIKLYPSPTSFVQENHLELFHFVGLMLGKAMYDGIVIDVPFATFFLRHLLSQQHNALYSPIDELPSLDPEFFKNLTWIKRYEGDIADLDLTFTHEEDVMGKIVTHELVPDGSSIPVTNDNKIMYVHKLAHYRLHTCIKEQTKAFIGGFRSIIKIGWTNIFSAPEFQRLISGDNVDIDLNDLKNNVMYYGGFHTSHRVIRWLWDILDKEYQPKDRGAFLKFVTSCSRPPLLGFSNLQPQFSIRCVEVSDAEDTGDTVGTILRGFFRVSKAKNSSAKLRLPTASTCFNLLKLPNYPSKQVLREKLKQAIANNTGFELS